MSANASIATLFNHIADALEVLGENQFKVLAYRKAARIVDDLSDDVAELCKSDLGKLKSIALARQACRRFKSLWPLEK